MGHNIKITLIKKIQLVEKWSQAFAVWDWYPWVLWVTTRVFKVWPAGQWEPLVTVGRPVGATTKHSRTGYFPHSLYLTAQSKTKGAFVFIYNTSNILTTHQPQPTTTTTEAYVWAFFFWDFSFRHGKCIYIVYITVKSTWIPGPKWAWDQHLGYTGLWPPVVGLCLQKSFI